MFKILFISIILTIIILSMRLFNYNEKLNHNYIIDDEIKPAIKDGRQGSKKDLIGGKVKILFF